MGSLLVLMASGIFGLARRLDKVRSITVDGESAAKKSFGDWAFFMKASMSRE